MLPISFGQTLISINLNLVAQGVQHCTWACDFSSPGYGKNNFGQKFYHEKAKSPSGWKIHKPAFITNTTF
jgi:hypothetical protein